MKKLKVIKGDRAELERELVRLLGEPNALPQQAFQALVAQLLPRAKLTLVAHEDVVIGQPPNKNDREG